MDCGAAGIRETLNRIDDAGLMRTGLFAGPAERRFALVEVNGIRLALLSWSTWYNRNETRLTDEGRRALLNEYAPDRAASDIAAARAAGAEFVLTYIHWGVDAEYKTEPSASMRRMAPGAWRMPEPIILSALTPIPSSPTTSSPPAMGASCLWRGPWATLSPAS